jgi:two-component system, cell cycle sensor histidine kinase and response regulator CckA
MSAAPARILIVEDERIIARELKERLTHMGHVVVGSVATGEQAVEQARALDPDLVLMDIKLQGELDGIAAAAIIQRETGVPVVYLTAFADDATLERAKQTQPYGYVLKPFQERELHVCVEMSLHRHRQARREREQQSFRDALVQSAADGIIGSDLDGRVRVMNRWAERLTGVSAADAAGRPLDEVAGAGARELITRDAPIRDDHGRVLGKVRIVRPRGD